MQRIESPKAGSNGVNPVCLAESNLSERAHSGVFFSGREEAQIATWLSRAGWRTAGTLFICVLLVSCGQPVREPVTLRYAHGWRFEPDEISTRVTLTQEFTQQTGIQVRDVPAPDNTFDQLELWRKLLEADTPSVDLVGIDSIWPATLDSDLI